MRDFMIAGGLIVVILLGCLYFILFYAQRGNAGRC